MRRLEKLLAVKDDPLPIIADVVIGVGVDVTKRGDKVSPQSRAIAKKCLVLFNAGRAENILLTGGYTIYPWPVTEARAMCDVIAWQVPWENIWLEEESCRTYGNADCSLPIVLEQGWKKVIIVAHQWHARRVRATFKKRWAGQGIEIHVIKAWSEYGGGSQSRLNHFFTFALWDTLAFVYSKLKGYC